MEGIIHTDITHQWALAENRLPSENYQPIDSNRHNTSTVKDPIERWIRWWKLYASQLICCWKWTCFFVSWSYFMKVKDWVIKKSSASFFSLQKMSVFIFSKCMVSYEYFFKRREILAVRWITRSKKAASWRYVSEVWPRLIATFSDMLLVSQTIW